MRGYTIVTLPGMRWRGRQKTRWKDSCKSDMESVRRRTHRTGQSGRMIFITQIMGKTEKNDEEMLT